MIVLVALCLVVLTGAGVLRLLGVQVTRTVEVHKLVLAVAVLCLAGSTLIGVQTTLEGRRHDRREVDDLSKEIDQLRDALAARDADEDAITNCRSLLNVETQYQQARVLSSIGGLVMALGAQDSAAIDALLTQLGQASLDLAAVVEVRRTYEVAPGPDCPTMSLPPLTPPIVIDPATLGDL